jgi:hypothetical protein
MIKRYVLYIRHAVVLLSVPYLCTAIRELRHKRMDDSELMTVQLTECHAGASFLPLLKGMC